MTRGLPNNASALCQGQDFVRPCTASPGLTPRCGARAGAGGNGGSALDLGPASEQHLSQCATAPSGTARLGHRPCLPCHACPVMPGPPCLACLCLACLAGPAWPAMPCLPYHAWPAMSALPCLACHACPAMSALPCLPCRAWPALGHLPRALPDLWFCPSPLWGCARILVKPQLTTCKNQHESTMEIKAFFKGVMSLFSPSRQ